MTTSPRTNSRSKIAIIGTGFSGLGMAIRLKQAGEHDFVIFEKEGGVGGTWRINQYPGCACDVQSHLYSFSFEPNPDWQRTFPPQPEIWAYLERCAQKYDLHPQIRFDTHIVAYRWDETRAVWELTDQAGNRHSSKILLIGHGPLSKPAYPKIEGLEHFQGNCFHSQRWDHDYPLQGKRVAVIGTGASAIQFVPRLQPHVARLDLYQRTPPWVVPKPDRRYTRLERWLFRHVPAVQKLYRGFIYSVLETRAIAFAVNPRFMSLPQRAAYSHIRRHIKDPELRRKVTPAYTFGCKRVLISNDYYPALAQPNVDVIATDIRRITGTGIETADGRQREVDAIILGTGFDSHFPFAKGSVIGREGRDLMDAWEEGLEAYKGTTVAGFPNLFVMIGPNTGLGHSSMIYMIESQIRYILDALDTMQRYGIEVVDVKENVLDRFNAWLQEKSNTAVWKVGGCRSWYLHPKSGKNDMLWPDFTWRFRHLTRRFDIEAYNCLSRPTAKQETAATTASKATV
ncbi:4-hydroxyacetophenone monooxygenase [Alkalilimnicola ehrlichii]|uniref:4-hydroxyacetophenone monooxygenase n=1 Tax=Alkalilimnicola ehrlichii TaxID=351052 RepID=A0A3E0WNZ6_9GAMM|nr:NAD(P)/FAD-dependent oxidoreductase [Alkalilimnicola ehrlichii]RFA26828.1 4-hydroxyacetophenone monooxygenase [Alkalilimnicola ehrlichii]RFA33923.1 4-hydroxyacetophenone monooxygenase [Alkalilimnicola ehrlichii]